MTLVITIIAITFIAAIALVAIACMRASALSERRALEHEYETRMRGKPKNTSE